MFFPLRPFAGDVKLIVWKNVVEDMKRDGGTFHADGTTEFEHIEKPLQGKQLRQGGGAQRAGV